jgi:hypothetical protein
LGSLIWSLTMIKSGLSYAYGLGFWGPNAHDGIWHLSIIESLSRFSLQMPVYAGENLKNYHFGFDLLVAFIHTLFRLPVSVLYFQILPPLLALGIGFFAYKFIYSWTRNQSTAVWSIFFIYFGGSWGWLISFIKNRSFGGESMFWSQQSISTLLNPPFALSVLLIFLGLWQLTQKLTTRKIILISLIFGLLAVVKIYAAILILGGLFVSGIYIYVIKKELDYLKIFLLTLVISLLLFLPFNSGSSSLIIWQPGWFLQTMLSVSDRFQWLRLYQALISQNNFKQLIGYSLAIIIFVFGNLGTRIIFLAGIKKLKIDFIWVLLFVICNLGFLLPMLFVQKGTPWNPIQFFYYSQFFIGIFAGITISRFKTSFLISSIFIILTLPTTLDALTHYLPSRPPAMISREEVTALDFLSRLPPGVVFTPPAHPNLYAPPPRPLYLYDSTAYVSAYSRHQVYLEDTVNLDITGFDWKARLSESEKFMTTASLNEALQFISDNSIRYLYFPEVSSRRPDFSASELGGKVAFENSQVAIWQISPR